MRTVIDDLLRRLRSPQAPSIGDFVTDAYLVLDQSAKYAGRPKRRWPRNAAGTASRWKEDFEAKMRREFVDLLPEPLLGLRLEEEEVDALTVALLALLAIPQLAAGAARGLGRSHRLYVVPNLVRLLLASGDHDPVATINATIAIQRLLSSFTDQELAAPFAQQVVADALAALERLQSTAKSDPVNDAQGQIAAELPWLRRRFGGSVAKRAAGEG